MYAKITYTKAVAATEHLLHVATFPDQFNASTKFTRLCSYSADAPKDTRWRYNDIDFFATWLARVTIKNSDVKKTCLLSAEGDVQFAAGQPMPYEKIPGAGISSPDSKFWGRMCAVKEIGTHIYACGDGGQVYQRSAAEPGEGVWRHMDPALLRNPQDFTKPLDSFYCINGLHEQELYVCGTKGQLLAWDGARFTPLQSGTRSSLTDILVESPDVIWICGRDDTLLRGNRREGFTQVPGIGGGHDFSSMAWLDGKLHLASSTGTIGLFTYDRGRLNQVRTSLTPDIHDLHTIGAVGDVLWVVGAKDILRFDGALWERIYDPDNDPTK